MPRKVSTPLTLSARIAPRSNRIDDRLEALIVAQERFIGALTEALAKFAAPMMAAPAVEGPGKLWQPGAVLYQPNSTTHPVPASGGRETPHSFGELMAKARESSVPRGTTRPMQADAATAFAPPMSDEQEADEEAWNAPGYDPNALSDMAAELAGDIEEDELPPPPDEEGLWRKRLSLNALRLWQPEWGPRPGQAGCLVPDHLLNGRG